MRFLNYYDKFAGNDVRKIEESIKLWAKNNPNGIMLIDHETLIALRSKLVAAGKKQPEVCALYFEEITICWTNVGGEKAILTFIYDNNNGKDLYRQPQTWKESDLWYQFK